MSNPELNNAIESAWAAFGGVPPAKTIAVWSQALQNIPLAHVRKALREASENGARPNLGLVKTRAQEFWNSASYAPIDVKPLTPDEKRKADKAAILSMLWLHYANGWGLNEFHNYGLAKLYGDNMEAAFKAAKEIYSRDLVLAWMEDQKRQDPAPCDRR